MVAHQVESVAAVEQTHIGQLAAILGAHDLGFDRVVTVFVRPEKGDVAVDLAWRGALY